MSDIVVIKKELGDALRELPLTKNALVNKQNITLNNTNTTTTPAPLNKVKRLAKLPDVEEYNEEREKLEPQIIQIKIKLEGNGDHFLILRLQLFYAVSQLTGRARNLAQEPVRNNLKEWTLIKTFYKWCHTKFGDPNAAITARRELKEIKQ